MLKTLEKEEHAICGAKRDGEQGGKKSSASSSAISGKKKFWLTAYCKYTHVKILMG